MPTASGATASTRPREMLAAGAGSRLPHARLPGRGLDVDPGPAAVARSGGRLAARLRRDRPLARPLLAQRRTLPRDHQRRRARIRWAAPGRACEALQEAGCAGRTIAVVSGDDVLDLVRGADGRRANCCGISTPAEPIADVRDRLVTANAYLGAQPIAEALARGADLVITGRVADPSLTVAACAHRVRLALGRLGPPGRRDRRRTSDRVRHASHRRHLDRLARHARRRSTSASRSSRSPTTGVASSPSRAAPAAAFAEQTVKEQLVYEIGDPDAYLSPDVTVSFLSLRVEDEGDDRVRVRGARGRPAPPTYKVSATYQDGFRAQGQLTIFGADAVAKARRAGQAVLERLAASGVSLAGSGRRMPWRRGLPPAGHRSGRGPAAHGNRAAHRRGRRFARGGRAIRARTDAAGDGRSAGDDRLRRRPSARPSAVSLLAVPDRTGAGEPQIDIASGHRATRGKCRDASVRRDRTGATTRATGFSRSSRRCNHAHVEQLRDELAAAGSATSPIARSGDKGIHANIGVIARRPDDFPAAVPRSDRGARGRAFRHRRSEPGDALRSCRI